jgi:GntR family transcriptional regulator, N-acetylglucosamine utilization regulator
VAKWAPGRAGGASVRAVQCPRPSQLRDILLELMTSDLTADDPIPSERELKQRFKLSRMPVRRAIDRLVADGHLYRAPGKGTVPPHPSDIGGDI